MKRKLTLWPLVAATFFMVSGGPYGLEELVQAAGYGGAILALLVTPLLWSLPTALMIGELSSALPEEGGYYVWVRRALGPFWGFQEAWLSLAASIFDMAIYPTLFVLYLRGVWPSLGDGHADILLGALVIAACAAWNLRGAPAVGKLSLVFAAALLAPFAVMSGLALLAPARVAAGSATAAPHAGILAGMMVAMWNYMGWDNATTVAGEVENPQRTYPRGVVLAVILVALIYVLPVLAVSRTGIDPSQWTTGSWVAAAEALGGRPLALAVVLGGMLCGLGMMNALVLSYSRVPLVLAEDGYLPRLLARKDERTGVPWVSVLACSVAWCAALGLGFERLIVLDVLLYGLALILEFVALVALRLREPGLERPFRVPGGLAGAVLLGVAPTLLIGVALAYSLAEQGSTRALLVGCGLVALGPLLYAARLLRQRFARLAANAAD